MKYLAVALLASSASAFTTPPLTFAVSKKAPAKKMAKPAATKAVKKAAAKPAKKVATKPVAKKVATKPVAKMAAPKPKPMPMKAPVKKAAPKPAPKPKVVSKVGTIPSNAIPGESAPALLDGSIVGDAGFDPCFLSTKADAQADYFNGILGVSGIDGLTWYREAELMHGRICQLAVVGFLWPGFFGSISGNEAYSYTNPLEAWGKVPQGSILQILAFMSFLEFRRIQNIREAGSSYIAGDSQRWGQGEGRFNPFGLNYTPEEYAEKQLQETKHGRLAMVGFLGVLFQASASGVSVADQLGAAFSTPDYVAKAGYFLPEGI